MKYTFVFLAACGAGVHGDPSNVTVVTSGLTQPAWLAQDTTNLYVVEQITAGYQLLRVPKTGGTAQVLASDPVIDAVAADDDGVYWIAFDGHTGVAKGLAHGATMPAILGQSTNFFNGSTLRNMVIDAQAVYFSDEAGSVWRVPRAGGGAVMLGVTDTTVGAVALAPSGVWVSTLHGAKILTPAGPGLELAFGNHPPDALASDGDTLFAMLAGSGLGDGTIIRVSTAEVPQTLTSTLILPTDIVADGGSLYIATANSDSAIRVMPESGGEPLVLADGNQDGRGPGSIVVDADSVYWTETYLGQVRRIAR
jgi:hypothetical protein